jgi:hypothetical protein
MVFRETFGFGDSHIGAAQAMLGLHLSACSVPA